jgi:hypothetical protein
MGTKDRSALEKVTGSLPAEAVAAALAVFDPAHPILSLTALLPVLNNSLAHGRAEKRIRETLEDLDARLSTQSDHINRFTDAQYRLTVGIVQTIFETVDEEKLRMLKAAVLNVANSNYLEHFRAQLISRILRDISAAEINFLHKTREYLWYSFAEKPNVPELTLRLIRGTEDSSLARGLIGLGLIVRAPSEGLMSDTGAYVRAPFAPDLMDLVIGADGDSDDT